MEALAVLLVLGALGVMFGLPIASFVIVQRLKGRVRELETQALERTVELGELRARSRALADDVAELQGRVGAAAPRASGAPAPEAGATAASEGAVVGEREVAAAAAAREAAAAAAREAATAREAAIGPDAAAASEAVPASAAASEAASAASTPATAPGPRPAPVPPRPAEPRPTLEQQIAYWLPRIGAGAVLLGILYFYKYAVDNDWVGPLGRVLVGIAAGVALLVGAEWVRRSTRPPFVHALIGLGLAALYVSIYASSAFYHLVDTEIAFGLNLVVLGLGAALADRHRAEIVLTLVLVAGFLNPVLLSTGVDRPVALFTYLFVMTAAAGFVSVRRGFGLAPVLTVLGTLVLYVGWYDRFFATYDHRTASDVDLGQALVGAYHELGPRLPIVGFVFAFVAAWSVMGLAFRGRGGRPKLGLGLVLAGLSLGHVGVTSLLYDHQGALGGAMIGLLVASVVALGRAERRDLLVLPMATALAFLAANLGDTPSADQLEVLGVAALWTLGYAIAFLVHNVGGALSPASAARAAAAIGSFVILALVVLLPNDEPLAAVLVVDVASLLAVILAHRSRELRIEVVGLAFAVTAILAAGGVERGLDAPRESFVLALLLLAALHLGSFAVAARRGERLPGLHAWALASAILGALFAALESTPADVPTLRAGAAALAGLLALGGAAACLGRPSALAAPAPTIAPSFSALALGLFAVAIGFGFSGAAVTIVWAFLAAVAISLFARRLGAGGLPSHRDDLAFVILAALLVLATIARVLGHDLDQPERELRLYLGSTGRLGTYPIVPLRSERTVALVGVAAAFLFAAHRWARRLPADASGRGAVFPGALAVVGHAVLLGLVILEVRAALVDFPPAPDLLLDPDEFEGFRALAEDAIAGASGRRAMSTTLVLGSFAIALVVGGFAAKDRFHRYLGLVLFGGTVLKLGLVDVWSLARTHQIVVLIGVGVLMLLAGYLYAKTRAGPAALGVLLASLVPGEGRAEPLPPVLDVSGFEYRRPLAAPGEGDFFVPIDLPLYGASKDLSLLGDVRFTDAAGRAVPHYLFERPPPLHVEPRRVEVFDAGRAGDELTAIFEVPPGPAHCRIELAIDGRDFVHRVEIAAGQTSAPLTTIGGGIVYDLDGARRVALEYPPSLSRYLSIRLLDSAKRGLSARSITGGEVRPCAPRWGVIGHDRLPLAISDRREDPTTRKTTIVLDAGAAGIPLAAIALDVGTPEFVRAVAVEGSSGGEAWPSIGRFGVHRVASVAGPDVNLDLPVDGARKRYYRLTIENGDDAPLDVRGAVGRVERRAFVVRARGAGPMWLYVGSRTPAPVSFDLAAVHSRGAAAVTATLSAGPPEPNPSLGQRPEGRRPLSERHRPLVLGGIGVLTLFGVLVALRLLRAAPEPGDRA